MKQFLSVGQSINWLVFDVGFECLTVDYCKMETKTELITNDTLWKDPAELFLYVIDQILNGKHYNEY